MYEWAAGVAGTHHGDIIPPAIESILYRITGLNKTINCQRYSRAMTIISYNYLPGKIQLGFARQNQLNGQFPNNVLPNKY